MTHWAVLRLLPDLLLTPLLRFLLLFPNSIRCRFAGIDLLPLNLRAAAPAGTPSKSLKRANGETEYCNERRKHHTTTGKHLDLPPVT